MNISLSTSPSTVPVSIPENKPGDEVRAVMNRCLLDIEQNYLLEQNDVFAATQLNPSILGDMLGDLQFVQEEFLERIPSLIFLFPFEKANLTKRITVWKEALEETAYENEASYLKALDSWLQNYDAFPRPLSDDLNAAFAGGSLEQISCLLKSAAIGGFSRIVEAVSTCERFQEISKETLGENLMYADSNRVVLALINCSRSHQIPEVYWERALTNAVMFGHLSRVQALISHSCFNRISIDSFAIALADAAHFGHLHIVQVLMDCSRFNEIKPQALERAASNALLSCRADVAYALIGCSRLSTEGLLRILNDMAGSNFVLTRDSFDILMASSRFFEIPSPSLGAALNLAVEIGNSLAVEAFIHCSRFDNISSLDLGAALSEAASKGREPIVRDLLQSSRFRDIPVHSLRNALMAAISGGFFSITLNLVECGRVQEIPESDLSELREMAQNSSAPFMANLAKSLVKKNEATPYRL